MLTIYVLLTLGAHAQRGLQYSVCVSLTVSLCHCVTVSDTTLQASVVDRTLKFRHQRSVNDTLQCFDSWILLKMLGSRDKAEFVSQEAYDRSYTRPIIRIYANKTRGDVINKHAWRGSLHFSGCRSPYSSIYLHNLLQLSRCLQVSLIKVSCSERSG